MNLKKIYQINENKFSEQGFTNNNNKMKLQDLKKIILEEVKKLKEANLIEKGKHPGCDCPGSPPNVPPFYKTWAQCTSGSGGVTSCAGCCQGGVRTPDTPEDARVDGGEPKNPKNPKEPREKARARMK